VDGIVLREWTPINKLPALFQATDEMLRRSQTIGALAPGEDLTAFLSIAFES
jgi:hypothetical protein